MAKSGQCNSQKRHPVHSLGRSMTGAPMSLWPITFFGQKALQIPHDLHHAGIITGVYSLLRFPDFFAEGILDLSVISGSYSAVLSSLRFTVIISFVSIIPIGENRNRPFGQKLVIQAGNSSLKQLLTLRRSYHGGIFQSRWNFHHLFNEFD